MIPWIQVYSNLMTHRKTGRLADELGLTNSYVSPDVVAVGILVSLWAWAVQNAYNGDLSSCSPRTIAEACRWRKKPDTLVAALKAAEWLDEDGTLHDWDEYMSLLVEKEDSRREKNRERVKRYREKKALECNADVTLQSVTCNVTDTPCNAPTITNTITNTKTIISGGGGDGGGARAREAVGDFRASRSLGLDTFVGMTPALKAEVRTLSNELFTRFADRHSTTFDEVNVYLCSHKADEDFNISIDGDRRDLLCYAFEAAANVGKAGDWNYIRGILRNMQQRGIETLADAEDYDDSRRS